MRRRHETGSISPATSQAVATRDASLAITHRQHDTTGPTRHPIRAARLAVVRPKAYEFRRARRPPPQLHHGATRATVAPMPSPYPAARIAVDDNAWRAFRQAAIVRGIPVS